MLSIVRSKWRVAVAILALCVAALVYSFSSLLFWDCGVPEVTLEERQLENGDWIKIRQEPDCSPTGGARIHLYVKTRNTADYKKLTFWSGTTTDQLQIHLDAATPLILTPSSTNVFVRSDEHGWERMSVTRITNTQLPANYPAFEQGSVMHQSFSIDDNRLVVRGVTANLSQLVELKLRAAGQFDFVDFVDQPKPLGASSEALLTLPASFPWSAARVGSDEDGFTLELRLRSVDAAPLISLPTKCATTYAAICERTRVVVAPDQSLNLSTPSSPMLLSIGWLTAPGHYETESYLIRDGALLAVNMAALLSSLESSEHPVWSVEPTSTLPNNNDNHLKVNLSISQLGSDPDSWSMRPGDGPLPPSVIDDICTNYTATLAVETDASSEAKTSTIGQIINIEYSSIHAHTLCGNRSLPSLSKREIH